MALVADRHYKAASRHSLVWQKCDGVGEIAEQRRYFPNIVKAIWAMNVDLHRGPHRLHDRNRAACERAGNQRLRGADGVCPDAASSRY